MHTASSGEEPAPTTSGTSTGEPAPESTGTEAGSTSEPAGTSSTGSTGAETGTSGTSTGEPLTDCPCQDGADNVCDLAPGTCSATSPGGYCDPDGDGAYFDGDFNLGWTEYQAKCG